MHPRIFFLHALKGASIALLAVMAIVAYAALTKGGSGTALQGRLVEPQTQGIIPTSRFQMMRTRDGFLAPADTHVLFDIPLEFTTSRVTFFGGPDVDERVRYWGYCFSGNEAALKAAGKRGKALYDGTFFYSTAERKAQAARPPVADNDLLGLKDQSRDTSVAPERPGTDVILPGSCYVMVDGSTAETAGFGGGIPAGVDLDGDGVNGARETAFSTNPENPDTDNDGLSDGTEIFVSTTNPLDPDTDKDGLIEGCEDKNLDGRFDQQSETSPLAADTDRDTLCDGNGFGAGCPEPKQPYCYQDPENNRVCSTRPSSGVYGEDMNGNCTVDQGETDPRNASTFGLPDFDYKWNVFVTKYGFRPSGQGVNAPEFPIPGLPVDMSE